MLKVIADHLRLSTMARRCFTLLTDDMSFISYDKNYDRCLQKIIDGGEIKLIVQTHRDHIIEIIKVNGKKILPELFFTKHYFILDYTTKNNVRVHCNYQYELKRWVEKKMFIDDVPYGLHFLMKLGSPFTSIIEYHQPEIKTRHLIVFDLCNLQKSILNKYIKEGPTGWNRNANYRSIKYHEEVFQEGYLLIPSEGGKINLYVKFIDERASNLNGIDIQNLVRILNILHKNPEDCIINELINTEPPRKKIRVI